MFQPGMCLYLRVLRAERVSLFVCLHQEWSVCVCACVCTYQEPIVYALAFAHFESRTCFSMCLHTLGADSLLHAFEGIKSWKCVCMCCACLESGILLHPSASTKS